MQKKIKIMGGGTSLIVPHLCDQLISEGYQVRVVDILDKQVPCEIMKLTENRPS
jgi:UDP-glucose 4-epimerase